MVQLPANSDIPGARYDSLAIRHRLAGLVQEALKVAWESGELSPFEVNDLGIERTTDPAKGDWTSTVALRSAKVCRQNPRAIAACIKNHLPSCDLIDSVEVAGAGFLNFRLTKHAHTQVFEQVIEQGDDYGRSNEGHGTAVNVEYVSANPVGPMHIGHGRWAALGDSICNILDFCGWNVTREFYINDAGNQMETFARSLDKRYRQICELVRQGMSSQEAYDAIEADRVCALDDTHSGSVSMHPLSDDFAAELGADAYGGAYIIDLARLFYDEDGNSLLDLDASARLLSLRERGYKLIMDNIKQVLSACGCEFDVWFSERSLHVSDDKGMSALTRAFDMLRTSGKLFTKDGALWFRTTDYGDDKDRVLMKSDGAHTYFASDIAYHANKFERGFERLIDLWGADHHGYIGRMQAAACALGHPGQLDIVLGQLVNLMRSGVPVRMSKRKGTMVSFEELLEVVGKDAARFTLLSRSSDQEVDFDIDVVTRQSSDNPVYYVQYAHARICSILRKAAGYEDSRAEVDDLDGLSARLVGLNPATDLLVEDSEIALADLIGRFGETVLGCAKDLAPYRLTHYATDLACAFHVFYTNCHVLCADDELRRARLCACDAARRVLAKTLGLLGVSAPQRM